MESTRSWAKDYGKRRYDVTVQEVDLHRLIAERDADPVAVAAGMTTWDVQMIMDHEAMTFLHWSLSREPDEPAEEHKAKASAHRAARDQVLDKYVPRKPADEVPAESGE
jgi:hypothetical protein